MEKIRLGKTELMVTKTGMGCLPIQRCDDDTAVKILTDSLHDKKQTNFYIFAVRYCVMHEPEHFPFYNAATVRSLKYCRDNHGFYNFSNDELLNYAKYKKILSMFRKKYGLTELSIPELSWVLSASGKLLSKREVS